MDRDPDAIRRDIDQARQQLASTVDTLTERANPRRVADQVKTRVVAFIRKPAVIASAAGLAALGAAVMVRRARNRRWEIRAIKAWEHQGDLDHRRLPRKSA